MSQPYIIKPFFPFLTLFALPHIGAVLAALILGWSITDVAMSVAMLTFVITFMFAAMLTDVGIDIIELGR